jgi:HD-GYP domain-containing protein (c-di-GMP phosphodiesterase class II)
VRLVELGIGALLHDIGKILVPQDVLNKPENLEDDEYGILKLHTIRGYEALKHTKQFSEASLEAILSHHERCDGKGYPMGKSKDQLHVYAKIVSVADVFDAVTADKVYRKKEDPYRAMHLIIDELDTKFDREIVKKFLKVVGYYPLGLYVTLNNGEYGVITKVHQNRPTVRILYDMAGTPVRDNFIVDLLKNPSVAIVDIDPAKTKYQHIESEKLS